ncbi:phage Terminase [Novosphingobium aromaticivorans DSM 12444]|uniref:Phage Terminase n=1 Tax=Novosphingobium aromaticivorans (strain ATCC 700278 / DSM 12444 / CCUG 56034 / CIP 105152 / NBRC 16084 / F199) TaxID=279238 RepID=Q2GAN0_NOVAD|nr:phage Terminase [Novosphingobium aromaticivorans DSM 12444]SCY95943.1 Phage terminase-like protein, large subunit, contains N-terminal HTH domain [Novosphingobium aromaticivorans]
MARPVWSTACQDWRERIVARESIAPCGPLFPAKAADALGVFKSLQVTDLPKRENGTHPTLGEVCDQFVFDLVAAIFGAEDPETGERLIKEFMLLISKKNGKSMIAAGIMVTALILNWRPNAILQILAPTIEVANNSFEPAMGMVRADAELAIVLKVVEHQRQIKHLTTGAVLRVIAADSDTVAGGKAAMTLIEELWLFGKKAKAAAMLREALGGGSARPEGFTLYITTHSDEPPAGVFKTKLSYFRDVRDGEIEDPATFPMLYEWPEDLLECESYLDPEFFYVTNPHVGRSVSIEWLKSELQKEQIGEGEGLQIFLAKHLNVEIGLRLRRDRWGGAELWLDAANDDLDLDQLLERCEVAIVGLDMGGRDDLAGAGVVGREKGTGIWLGWAHAWAQRVALERRKQVAPTLQGFAAEGDLTFTDSGEEIVSAMARLAIRVRDSGKMPADGGVAVDAWGIGPLVDALVQAGFDPGDEAMKRAGHIASIRQGVGLSSAIYTLEFKLGDGMFRHDGSNMMAWCVSNALVKLRGSALYVDKETSGAGKIDPFVALLNAVKRMEEGPVAVAGGVDSWLASLRGAA